jgi:hypothetical protein
MSGLGARYTVFADARAFIDEVSAPLRRPVGEPSSMTRTSTSG